MKGAIDVVLMVTSIKPDKWDEYISILKPRGKIILVTAGSDTLGILYVLDHDPIDIVHSYRPKRISNLWVVNSFQERNEFDARVCSLCLG